MKMPFALASVLLVFGAASQVSFGLKAGLSFPSFSAQYKPAFAPEGAGSNYKIQRSYIVGICADIPLRKAIFFRPGVELIGKKATTKYLTSNGIYPYTEKIITLDFPLNVVYKKGPKDKPRIVAGAGLVPGLIFMRAAPLSRGNLGLNVLAGYELPVGLNLNANYTYGLLNAANDEQQFTSARLHYFGLSIGYFF